MPNQESSAETPTTPYRPTTPLRQLALQGAAAIAILSLAWPYFGLRAQALPWPETALAIGTAAFVFARISRQPVWWQIIHASFAPAAWAVSLLNLAPGWFLLAFILLWIVFRGAATGQIPLYLTNATTVETLAVLLRTHAGARFVDLGAGVGSTVIPLSRALPHMQFTGIEDAPASWGIGWIRTREIANLRWLMSNLWQAPLEEYDVVYAFLSPAPMPELWEKVRHEMKPGGLFISNSFPIPKVEPDDIIELEDGRRTHLYCYRIPGYATAEFRSD